MSPTQLKRQRSLEIDNDEDELFQRDLKKLRCLPFREPSIPDRPASHSPSRHGSRPVLPILNFLTLVESPVETSAEVENHFPREGAGQLVNLHAEARDGCPTWTLPDQDDAMELVKSPPYEASSPQAWQRPRSNDMMAPPRMRFMTIPTAVGAERIPTPVYGYFNHVGAAKNSNQDVAFSTVLSPMLSEGEESYLSPRSPVPSLTWDTTGYLNSIGQTDHMMGRLNVGTLDFESQSLREGKFSVDGQSSFFNSQSMDTEIVNSKSRSCRLFMGYRSDCDKCIRRIPGHYSHIIRD